MRTWFKRALGAAALAGGLLALGGAAQATESAQASKPPRSVDLTDAVKAYRCGAVGLIASRAGTCTAAASEALSRPTGQTARIGRSSVRSTTRELVRPVRRAAQRLGTKAPAVSATARLGHDAGDGVQANAGVSVDDSLAAGAGLAVKRPGASSAPAARAGIGAAARAAKASIAGRADLTTGATARGAAVGATLAAGTAQAKHPDTTTTASANLSAQASATKGHDTTAGVTTNLGTSGNGATAGLGVMAARARVKQGATAASVAADLVASEPIGTCESDSTAGAGGTLAAGVVRPLLARPVAGRPQSVDQVVGSDGILDGVQVGELPVDLGLGRLGYPVAVPELPAGSSDPGQALLRDPSSLAAELDELLLGVGSAVGTPMASAVPGLDAARLTTPPSC